MKPPARKQTDFEKVVIGEMIPGAIEEVQYEQEHRFKGFQGKEDTIAIGIRFKFKLDGYTYPHYSRWMKLTLGEKSNLYKKYVSKLVENALPDMDYDLDGLKGLRVKTLWAEENGYQNLESIFPALKKAVFAVAPDDVHKHAENEDEPPVPDEVPF